jgi:hypothetical protein
MRNADTAKIDRRVKSDIHMLHAEDIKMAAKRLMSDFRMQLIHGLGAAPNLNGFDYFLDLYAGSWASGAYVPATDFGSAYSERKMFSTSDDSPLGTKKLLDLPIIEDFVSNYKGEGYEVIYSDRRTAVELKNILNAAPGNTAEMIMDERFGKPVMSYSGIPWVVLDSVGQEKVSDEGLAASVSLAATGILTVNTAVDPYFIGFSDLDVGRTWELYDTPRSSGGSVIASGTMTDFLTTYTIDTDATGSAVGPGYLYVAATPVIYAGRFDETDGITAIFGRSEAPAPDAGEYEGPVAGFEAEELGILEASPFYRTRLDWIGNFVVQNPYAIARLSHYSLT